MTTGIEGKITDAMIEEVLREKGKEYPIRRQWNEEASRDTIRHFADGSGDLNPLWRDDEYAGKTRYGGIIAPPTFVLSVAVLPGRFGLPGIHNLQAGADLRCYQPIKVGERIFCAGGLHDIVEREKSRWAGRTFLQTFVLNYRNAKGDLLAKLYHRMIRGERQAASKRGKYAGIQIKPYTKEELATVWEGIEKEERRGAKPRYWEDVNVGDELTPVVKGPLTVSDMVAWKMGWGSHFPHHMWANEVRYYMYKRHPQAPVLNALNVPDAPETVHVDRDLPKKLGFPTFYDYGPNRIAWLGQLLTNWMGDDGFLEALDTETRLPNFEGDIQWCRGKVTRKYQKEGKFLVDIDVAATNQRGEVSMPGKAIVSLPSRGKRA